MGYNNPAKKLRKQQAARMRSRGKKKNVAKPAPSKPSVITIVIGKPKYSIISAAHREYNYRGLYDSLATNNTVPFEVILVGPNPPKEKMPDNFKYIKTDVKPAQCYEIAAREAVGEFLMPSGDDLRYADGFLNKLDHYYMYKIDTSRVFITFRYSFNGVLNDAQLVYDENIPNSPIVGWAGVFKKDIWHGIGGLDNRFVSAFSDIDMQLRFYEYGLNIFIPPDCIVNEIPQKKGELTSFARTGYTSREILNSLWIKKDGTFSKTRLSPVESYIDEDILIKSQGCAEATGKKGVFKWV